MEKTVINLYNGMVQLKDYYVEEALAKGISITINHANKKMTLSPEELVSKRVHVTRPFPSKHDTPPYRLYGYMWNPNT